MITKLQSLDSENLNKEEESRRDPGDSLGKRNRIDFMDRIRENGYRSCGGDQERGDGMEEESVAGERQNLGTLGSSVETLVQWKLNGI